MIYYMQDDKNKSLDHIIKKNHNKVQSIFFLSKLLTDAETQYWFTELEITCMIWTVKKIHHMISRSLAETVIWTDYSCHGPGHMTVSHGISGSRDPDITRPRLRSDPELAPDSGSAAWRFPQKPSVPYIRLSCTLPRCWPSSMSWWPSDRNRMPSIGLAATTPLRSTAPARWAARGWEGRNPKPMGFI